MRGDGKMKPVEMRGAFVRFLAGLLDPSGPSRRRPAPVAPPPRPRSLADLYTPEDVESIIRNTNTKFLVPPEIQASSEGGSPTR